MAFSDFQAQQDQEAAAAAKAKADAAAAAPAPVAPAPVQAANPPAASQQQQTPPPASADPSAPAPGGYDLGPVHLGYTNRGTPGMSWQGGGLGGWMPSSQTVHNVTDRMFNNVLWGGADPITAAASNYYNPGSPNLVTLRAQRQQMDASMSPAAKAVADTGAQFSPTNQNINRIPVIGPMVQGAVLEGGKSFGAGNDTPTALNDAARGAVTGLGSQVAANTALNPWAWGQIAGHTIDKAAPLGIGLMGHGFGGLIARDAAKPYADAIRDWGARTAGPGWSEAARAVQNLLFGAAPLVQKQPDNR
jgi:hypothetical protein